MKVKRHRGRPAWEWLLEQANKLGIRGGSAFRAMAGFGRHHKLTEAKFFELAGALAVEVEFIVTEGEAQQLLNLIPAIGRASQRKSCAAPTRTPRTWLPPHMVCRGASPGRRLLIRPRRASAGRWR